jgi:hypothetical protein
MAMLSLIARKGRSFLHDRVLALLSSDLLSFLSSCEPLSLLFKGNISFLRC